ncbi:hypothetical protein [Halobacterium hubeiense]|uniref:hypothetical protein n=1 Tax=Halobacterium hubeiense TaxID=1407499 RepID=UPI001C4F0DE2|nr:hypothetical protein [Halobacterium hubeiense]
MPECGGRATTNSQETVCDEFDTASLNNAITARTGGRIIPIGPLELQVAYKLHLGTQKDVEDAVHLYTLFEETRSGSRLETWLTSSPP